MAGGFSDRAPGTESRGGFGSPPRQLRDGVLRKAKKALRDANTRRVRKPAARQLRDGVLRKAKKALRDANTRRVRKPAARQLRHVVLRKAKKARGTLLHVI